MALKEIDFKVAEDLSVYSDCLFCHNDDDAVASLTMKDEETGYMIDAEIILIGENRIITADGNQYTNPDEYPAEVINSVLDGSIYQKTASDDMYIDSSMDFNIGTRIYNEDEKYTEFYCDSVVFERCMSSMNNETPETLREALTDYAIQVFEYSRETLQELANTNAEKNNEELTL